MKTGTIIGISVLSLLAIGGVVYAMSGGSKKPLVATTTTTTEGGQVVHGGLISSFKGILDGLKVSIV